MFEDFLCRGMHYEELKAKVRETYSLERAGLRTELCARGMLNDRGFRVASSDFGMTSRNLKIRDTPRLRLAMVG